MMIWLLPPLGLMAAAGNLFHRASIPASANWPRLSNKTCQQSVAGV
jgi:hypothetical protein